MKTNVVEKGEWERELEVEVPTERIEEELIRAYKKFQKRLEIPGFRKGKVPMRVIKSRYADAIRSDVINDLLPSLVQEATRATGLVPAAPPKITQLDHEPGRELTFTATLDIWPEIEVQHYEGLEVVKSVHEVGEEEIEGQLRELQQRQATEQSVERPLEEGDVLIADLQKLDDGGLPIIGERFEERYFFIGNENAPSPEFEEALIGISAGEERRVRFTYRDDLPNEELAGQPQHFSVTAREVRTREVPQLDDEFAKDLGAQFQNLDDLRQHIGEQIEQRWDHLNHQKQRYDLTSQLIEKNAFDLPESMVENYLHSLRQDHDHDHDHDHSDEERDHDHSDEERDQAVYRLKGHLLIEALRKQSLVEVGEQDFEAFLQARAAETGIQVEDLKRSERLDDLHRELEEHKIFGLLIEKANIKEEKV